MRGMGSKKGGLQASQHRQCNLQLIRFNMMICLDAKPGPLPRQRAPVKAAQNGVGFVCERRAHSSTLLSLGIRSVNRAIVVR